MSSAVLHKRLLLLANKPELRDYRSKLQTLGNAIGFGEMIPMINAHIYSRAKDFMKPLQQSNSIHLLARPTWPHRTRSTVGVAFSVCIYYQLLDV